MNTTRGGKSKLLAGETSNNTLKGLTPGTTPYIEALMKQAALREFPEAIAEVEPPPPDTDYLRAKELVGCWVCVMGIESIEPKQFPGSPKARMTVTYNIYVYNRPDLGQRKLSLANRYAIEQAHYFMANYGLFPGVFEVAVKDPENGQFASIWLARRTTEEPPSHYYHKPWREEPPLEGDDDDIVDGSVEEYQF